MVQRIRTALLSCRKCRIGPSPVRCRERLGGAMPQTARNGKAPENPPCHRQYNSWASAIEVRKLNWSQHNTMIVSVTIVPFRNEGGEGRNQSGLSLFPSTLVARLLTHSKPQSSHVCSSSGTIFSVMHEERPLLQISTIFPPTLPLPILSKSPP